MKKNDASAVIHGIPFTIRWTGPVTCTLLLLITLTGCSSRKFFIRPITHPASMATTELSTFERRWHRAQELAYDDRIAWRTSDTISAEKRMLLDTLDQTWFVYPKDNLWYAYYGRFSPEDDRYYPKYAFTTDRHGTILRLPPSVDDTTLGYARAVSSGISRLQSIIDSLQMTINFNHYIRKKPDASYRMWFFPAGYANYCAQGFDISMLIDSTGRTVKSCSITGKFPRYFELDKKNQTVELENPDDSLPSLGNFFFTAINRKHFEKIKIITSSTVNIHSYSTKEKEWVWERRER